MACSLTVAALLHPWSGRLDRISRLPTLKPSVSALAATRAYSYYPNINLRRGSCASIETDHTADALHPLDPGYRLDSLKLRKQHSHSLDDLAIQPVRKEDYADSIGGFDSVEAASVEADSQDDSVTSVHTLDDTEASLEASSNSSVSSWDARKDDETEQEPHLSSPSLSPEPEEYNSGKFSLLPLVTKLSPSPIFQNDCFKVARSTIAGWGAFAVKDLHFGETILREFPLFTDEFGGIFEEFNKLDEGAKNVALSLHANELLKAGTPRLQAVWDTNCFAIDSKMAGLFPIAARFNHACHPVHNIEYSYDRGLGCLIMTVRSDKIAAGEELKISYGTGRTPQVLYFWYGFQCRCGACKGLSDEEVALLTEQW